MKQPAYVAKVYPAVNYRGLPEIDQYITRGSATKWAERWWIGDQPFSNLTKARMVVIDALGKLSATDVKALYNIIECLPMSGYEYSDPVLSELSFDKIEPEAVKLTIADNYDYNWVNKYVTTVRRLYYTWGCKAKEICKLWWFKFIL